MTGDNLPCPRPKATNFYNSVYSSLPCNYPGTPCQLKNDNLPVSQPRRITFGYTLTSYGVSTSLHFPNRAVHYIREKTVSPLPPLLFRGRERGMMRKAGGAAFRHVHTHIPHPTTVASPPPISPPKTHSLQLPRYIGRSMVVVVSVEEELFLTPPTLSPFLLF